MEKHDTVLHWGKAHSWLTQLRTLHTDGTNLLRSLSASFSRQIFVLIYFQVLQDGPKTEPNRYKWPFKSMETSLVFFHPKELWNLFHPIRKWLVGLCWFVPKTVAFFFLRHSMPETSEVGPEKYHSSCLNLEVVLVLTPGLPIYNKAICIGVSYSSIYRGPPADKAIQHLAERHAGVTIWGSDGWLDRSERFQFITDSANG